MWNDLDYMINVTTWTVNENLFKVSDIDEIHKRGSNSYGLDFFPWVIATNPVAIIHHCTITKPTIISANKRDSKDLEIKNAENHSSKKAFGIIISANVLDPVPDGLLTC